MLKSTVLCYAFLVLLGLTVKPAHSTSELEITISRLKALPAGFVVSCSAGDLWLRGKLGQGNFKIKGSSMCFGKNDGHIVCIAGAAGEDMQGRPIANCSEIAGLTT
jgi:hypothetical protein